MPSDALYHMFSEVSNTLFYIKNAIFAIPLKKPEISIIKTDATGKGKNCERFTSR
jgi:hypothetical protein